MIGVARLTGQALADHPRLVGPTGRVSESDNPADRPDPARWRCADAVHRICSKPAVIGFPANPTTTGSGADHIADHCLGLYITLAMDSLPRVGGTPTADELRTLQRIKHHQDWDSGCASQQATRPQTLAYALTDSQPGQPAWTLERFWAWPDCHSHPENLFTQDGLLDNVMLSWVTASAGSSARVCWESFGACRCAALPVTIPTGVAVFPKEIGTQVRRWMEAIYADIRHWA